MKIIFWNVDTQNDFMNKDGKLYVAKAETIKLNLKRLTNLAKEHNITVVNTADYHTDKSTEISGNPDFKTTFPPHCMENTEGNHFIEETRPDSYVAFNYGDTIAIAPVTNIRNVIIYKDAFDVFKGNQYTEHILHALGPDLVVVYGVATNVCVDYAVMGLIKRKIKVIVVTDAIKGLPNMPVDTVLDKWEKEGVTLTFTESVEEYLVAVRR